MTNQPPAGNPSPFSAPVEPRQSPARSDSKLLVIILVVLAASVLLCGGALVAFMLPAIGMASKAAERMQRSNQVKQIGLGIHNYHSAYKQLPLTIGANEQGEPLVGWRIGIAPFVEAQPQWERVMENEGPGARNLVAMDAPGCFQAIDGEPGDTHVFAIVSPQSMFPPTPNTVVRFMDVIDGLSSTAMAIELPNRTANWASDQNMTPDEAYQALQELSPPDVAHLLMADGAVIAVTSDLDRATFDGLTTRAGGERIDPL